MAIHAGSASLNGVGSLRLGSPVSEFTNEFTNEFRIYNDFINIKLLKISSGSFSGAASFSQSLGPTILKKVSVSVSSSPTFKIVKGIGRIPSISTTPSKTIVRSTTRSIALAQVPSYARRSQINISRQNASSVTPSQIQLRAKNILISINTTYSRLMASYLSKSFGESPVPSEILLTSKIQTIFSQGIGSRKLDIFAFKSISSSLVPTRKSRSAFALSIFSSSITSRATIFNIVRRISSPVLPVNNYTPSRAPLFVNAQSSTSPLSLVAKISAKSSNILTQPEISETINTSKANQAESSSLPFLSKIQNRPISISVTTVRTISTVKSVIRNISYLLSPAVSDVVRRKITNIGIDVGSVSTRAIYFGKNFFGLARLIATNLAKKIGIGSGDVYIAGLVLYIPSEYSVVHLFSESIKLVLRLDDEELNSMALIHPVAIDPDEEIYLRIDAAPLLSPASEQITSSTFTPSSEATLDGHTLVDSFYDAGNRAFAFKPTGGNPNTQYAWVLDWTTTDIDNRSQHRKRTILVQVITK